MSRIVGEKVTSRDEVLSLAAGMADLVAEGMRDLARRLPGLTEARQELRARGELALKRVGAEPRAHMEVLARKAAERANDG
ncbi:hypothetical protein [Actinomadura sp. DC4]|uniref:hypothetical protein n=1 Tax=Actinomadura sp. DC4 TaxID=3055069 RepID=UPI0025B26562|nr:hypothetical protein [Actinomadura sp. DC4]MDN3353142.1 hypothetical protein [Actinomadura sp. DC4]